MEEQVKVAQRSCKTTPAVRSVSAPRTRVGMNPLCQEQCLVSGEKFVLVCDTRMKQGFGVRAPHTATVRRPEAGAAPRLHILLFRVKLTAQRIQQ